MMSEQINELATALSAFQGEMKAVQFDSSNPYFKSKYASLSALVDAASKVLVKHGLAVSQVLTGDGGVNTVLMHKSGQFIGDTLKLQPVKVDPQGVGSAITYARRYAYASILGLVSDSDDDGNGASTTPKGTVQAVKEAIAQPAKPTMPVKQPEMPIKDPIDLPVDPWADEPTEGALNAFKLSDVNIGEEISEYQGQVISMTVKTDAGKNKDKTITAYTVKGDCGGSYVIQKWGTPKGNIEGQIATFFAIKRRDDFKGKPQFMCEQVEAN